MTSPLYGFIGDHVIPRGTIKLAVMVEEHPRILTVVTEFLAVYCPLAFNGVIGRLLLKALRAVISIHCLTMKFPIAMRTGQVRGRQCDSKECYNRLLELAKKERKLPQIMKVEIMEVEKVSKGPMEMNVGPHLHEDKSTAGPIKELVKIQMDPKEPN